MAIKLTGEEMECYQNMFYKGAVSYTYYEGYKKIRDYYFECEQKDSEIQKEWINLYRD